MTVLTHTLWLVAGVQASQKDVTQLFGYRLAADWAELLK
jgi:hypothetical protein